MFLLSCLPLSFCYPQAGFHVFVNHVANADSRNDFHEVWQDATVEPKETIFGYNRPQQGTHGGLIWHIQRCCRKKKKLLEEQRWVFYFCAAFSNKYWHAVLAGKCRKQVYDGLWWATKRCQKQFFFLYSTINSSFTWDNLKTLSIDFQPEYSK